MVSSSIRIPTLGTRWGIFKCRLSSQPTRYTFRDADARMSLESPAARAPRGWGAGIVDGPDGRSARVAMPGLRAGGGAPSPPSDAPPHRRGGRRRTRLVGVLAGDPDPDRPGSSPAGP